MDNFERPSTSGEACGRLRIFAKVRCPGRHLLHDVVMYSKVQLNQKDGTSFVREPWLLLLRLGILKALITALVRFLFFLFVRLLNFVSFLFFLPL